MGVFTTTAGAIRRGLAHTRDALGGSLRSLLQGRPLSPEVIDEIEARMIRADVGPKATTAIVDELREAYQAGDVARGTDAVEFLKTRLKARFHGADRHLHTAPEGPTVILVVGVNGSGKTTSLAKLAKSLKARIRCWSTPPDGCTRSTT